MGVAVICGGGGCTTTQGGRGGWAGGNKGEWHWEPCCQRRAGDLSGSARHFWRGGDPWLEHVLGLLRAFWTLGESESCASRKLSREWTLILYGTAEHPYTAFSTHQSRSLMLELSASELLPRTAMSLSQAEVPEDEEDYTGT